MASCGQCEDKGGVWGEPGFRSAPATNSYAVPRFGMSLLKINYPFHLLNRMLAGTEVWPQVPCHQRASGDQGVKQVHLKINKAAQDTERFGMNGMGISVKGILSCQCMIGWLPHCWLMKTSICPLASICSIVFVFFIPHHFPYSSGYCPFGKPVCDLVLPFLLVSVTCTYSFKHFSVNVHHPTSTWRGEKMPFQSLGIVVGAGLSFSETAAFLGFWCKTVPRTEWCEKPGQSKSGKVLLYEGSFSMIGH